MCVCVFQIDNVCTHASTDRYERERRISSVCLCVSAPLTFTLFTYLPRSCIGGGGGGVMLSQHLHVCIQMRASPF